MPATASSSKTSEATSRAAMAVGIGAGVALCGIALAIVWSSRTAKDDSDDSGNSGAVEGLGTTLPSEALS